MGPVRWDSHVAVYQTAFYLLPHHQLQRTRRTMARPTAAQLCSRRSLPCSADSGAERRGHPLWRRGAGETPAHSPMVQHPRQMLLLLLPLLLREGRWTGGWARHQLVLGSFASWFFY